MGEFTPTTWNEGVAPGISAAQLNRIEAGIGDSHADASAHMDFETQVDTAVTLALGATFSSYKTFSYGVPGFWGTYRLNVVLGAHVEGVGSGSVHLQARIDGIDRDDFENERVTGSTEFPFECSGNRPGLSGTVDVILRARGSASSVAILHHAWFQAYAVQQS